MCVCIHTYMWGWGECVCVCFCIYTREGEVFGVPGPDHRESVCGLVTDACTELVWGNSVGWLEQKCTIPAMEDRVRSRVPAGLLSSHDCLPHGCLLQPVCQLRLDRLWHSSLPRRFVPRDPPSPSRGALPVCVSPSVHVCRISPFRKDTVILDLGGSRYSSTTSS